MDIIFLMVVGWGRILYSAPKFSEDGAKPTVTTPIETLSLLTIPAWGKKSFKFQYWGLRPWSFCPWACICRHFKNRRASEEFDKAMEFENRACRSSKILRSHHQSHMVSLVLSWNFLLECL